MKLKHEMSKSELEAYKLGVKHASEVADTYNSCTSHEYQLGDCIMAKFNLLDKQKVRKNRKASKPQRRQYVDHSGRIFEFVSNSVQQTENSLGDNISTYPSVILKNCSTGELVSVLASRLDLVFSPHFTQIKTVKQAKDFISSLEGVSLSTALGKSNYKKLDETADLLANQFTSKWYPHVVPHPDLTAVIKNAIFDVILSVFAARDKSSQAKK